MSSESKSIAGIELFYSYSQKDARLCELLETHLMALQRSGLIRSWYDRKIEPGAAWSEQIQSAMERAGIILLLISPDFIASDYCYEIELPFAMKRHASGDAVVIPVLLRPVVYQDAPFAKLQMLPKGARPVIEWGRRDEAFNDIAAAIRAVIIEKRLHAEVASSRESESQERVLDAAVPANVIVNEPADVVALIRLPDSKGLRAVLQSDNSYSVSAEEVKSSQTFEIQFPRDDTGRLLPASIQLELHAPGFDPPRQTQHVRIMPKIDSPVCVFMLAPRGEGRRDLVLNVLADGQLIASRLLVTKATNRITSAIAESPAPYNVIEVPLRTSTVSPSLPGDAGEYTAAVLRAPIPRPAVSSPQPAASGGAPGKPAQRKSKLPWIAVGAAAAAFALVVPSMLVNTKSKPPAEDSPTTVAAGPTPQLNETIASISRQIKQNPTNADLYVKRADAYKRANNLAAASKDVNKAIELAPNHPAALRLRTEIAKEQVRRQSARDAGRH